MRTRAVAWIGFGAAIVAACGTNSGSGGGGDGAPDDGGGGENMGIMPGDDAPSDGTGDGSGSSSSGGSSSGSGGDAAGDAPSDVAADGCAGQQPDPNGVFVSKGGQASGCGSETTPCTSIQTALTLAAMNGKTFVYVDTGTYTEQLTLPGAGITVQGGWTDLGGTWTRQCGASRASSVVVQAPGGVNTTVVAQYAGSATLDTLSIQSEPQAAVAAGESVYGVFATGAST